MAQEAIFFKRRNGIKKLGDTNKMKRLVNVALIMLMTAVFGASASAGTRQAVAGMSQTYASIFSGVWQSTKPIKFGIVEVGTGATPTIMFADDVWTATLDNYAYGGGAYTPFATKTTSLRVHDATWGPNNSNVATWTGQQSAATATATTSQCFSETWNFGPDMTSLPFGQLRPTWTTGGAPDPGACFPRYGAVKQTPGAKKYGGTLGLFGSANRRGRFVQATGFADFNLFQHSTTKLTAGSPWDEVVMIGTGTWTNTGTLNARQTQVQGKQGVWTTGTAIGSNPGTPYTTLVQRTGAFGLVRNASTSANTGTGTSDPLAAQLTGTISAVRPSLTNHFNRMFGAYTGAGPHFGAVTTFNVTFLPEPGMVAMLGVGVLGLVGLGRRRG
jgi:hypothetical protein